ncbi:hypothetical protein [Tenacibaculum agarivorans]|uniref:hypothetical protein n=1 Tax=Tenacibaculum agarivorans TaxID=1908389 RepID=UPI00094BC571|nr:hypothetical protein [Tenacibaculum agarivorans]
MEKIKILEELTIEEVREIAKDFDKAFFSEVIEETKRRVEKEIAEEPKEKLLKPISRELLTKPFEIVR